MKSFKKFITERNTLETGIGRTPTLECGIGERDDDLKEDARVHADSSRDLLNNREDKDTQAKLDDDTHAKIGRPSSMSQSERYAIQDYTHESRPLNKGFHGGEHTKHHKELIEKLDSLLDKHHTYEDTHVYTGIRRSPHQLFKGKEKETHVHLPAYTSTSSQFHVAALFSKQKEAIEGDHFGKEAQGVERHILHIHVPEGTKAQSIRHVSATGKHEQEVLLHRGHTISIHHKPTIAVHKDKFGNDNKYAVWHAKIVSHDL